MPLFRQVSKHNTLTAAFTSTARHLMTGWHVCRQAALSQTGATEGKLA